MKTIRGQLTRKLLLAVVVLVGVGGLAVYFCTRAALLAQFDATLRAKAQAITTLTEQNDGRVKLNFADELMLGFEARGGPDYFQLWQQAGQTVERSRSLGQNELPMLHGPPDEPRFWNLVLPEGRPGRAVGIKYPLQHPQENAPSEAILVVASVRRHFDHTLATLQIVLAGSGLLLLAATALVVPRVLRRELTPLQRLAADTARIDATSLSARFHPAELPGELVSITAGLNELLARLEDSFARERRFSAAVAHEFRTPVAELRCLAELALKLPDTRTASTDHEFHAIALHLESILTRLLTLARGEQAGLPVQRARVALAPLVEDVCKNFRAQAATRQLAFHCRVPGDATAQTDPVLLRSILVNLVDNAVEYTPGGGRIEVETGATHGRCTLRVTNTVRDFDERDLPLLFQPFWRKDAARATDGHTGLGLALARTFARVLGCELTATLAEPARLTLTLTLTEVEPAPRRQPCPSA